MVNAPKAKVPYGLDENLTHLLAINDVRISLAVALPEANAEILWWRSDWELRSHGSERIIPDALFLIRWHGLKDQAYALEVDNNTRSSKNFLRKILAYVSLQAAGKTIYGMSDPVILVAGSNPKWLERYRSAVFHELFHSRVWFSTIAEIKRAPVTEAIWANGEDKKQGLPDLS